MNLFQWEVLISEAALLVLVLGLLFGSLANVFIFRVPRDKPLGLFKSRRSQCVKCHKKIAIWDNIPLLSFLLLKGKCRHCKKRISIRYPFVELLTGLVLWLSFTLLVQENPQIQSEGLYWAWILLELYFLWSLIVVFFIDIDFRIIPDRFSLGSWGLALVACSLFPNYNFLDSVLGGIFGFGMFFLLAWGYEKAKGVEGLGFGDVKMMGWLGTWVGMSQVPLVILVGSTSGLIVGLIAMRRSKDGMQTAIPFGPFLAIGAFLVWLKLRFENLGIF